MMIPSSTINPQEIAKFSQHSNQWWDLEGPLKTLHDINPARILFMQQIYTTWPHAKVLDVGCGGGILSEAMAKLGSSVYGLDAEPWAIETAKRHALSNELSINYICQPIEEFNGELFDVITCMEMLEHCDNPELIIQHCARLLKPGGYLFLSTLNRTIKAYTTAILAAEYLLNLLPRQTHDFDKFIKPSELASLTRAAGFETVDISGLDYNPITSKASLTQSVSVNYLMACCLAK